MKRILVLFFLSVLYSVSGQTNQEGKNIAYRYENVVFGTLHTRGMGVGCSRGRIKGIYKTSYFNIELDYYKHPKEKKISFLYDLERGYVYGKENSLLNISLNKSVANIIFYKAEDNGVRVNYLFAYGGSLGILKPYYLNVLSDNGQYYHDIKFSEYDAVKFLTPNRINGYSGFFKGIGESKMIPALNLKAGLSFDFGTYSDLVRILEVGANFNLYSKPISIMIMEEPTRYYLTLYTRFYFGNRKVS